MEPYSGPVISNTANTAKKGVTAETLEIAGVQKRREVV